MERAPIVAPAVPLDATPVGAGATPAPVESVPEPLADRTEETLPSAPVSTAADTAAVADRAAIERLLEAYESAYDQRDVGAVAALWPSSDAAGLTRAFNSVKAQNLTFGNCRVAIEGDRATIECPGEIRYVRQVGGGALQTRRATWTITVVRAADRWQVGDVVVR